MTDQWIQCKLGDVVTLQRGFDLPQQERHEGTVPIVTSSGITGYHDVAKVKGPGVVTGRYGTLGKIFYIKEGFWPHNTTLYVRDFKGNDPLFVSYFLGTLALAAHHAASAVPGVNRNALHLLPVKLPPFPTQRKIAAILSAYDDLIENNTRRIALLEQMAQLLYREWFVRLHFPGHESVRMVESALGEIPEGWSRKNLYDVAEVITGYPFKSNLFSEEPVGTPVIRIRDILNNATKTYTTEIAGNQYIVENGDILIGMDGDFHMTMWAGGKAYLNQRVTRIRPLGELSSYYLYHALESPIQFFNSTIMGTTVAHLGKQHLETIEILYPDIEMINWTRETLQPLLAQSLNLQIRNALLRRTRDLLLPRLIAGEVDVAELEVAS